MTDTFRNTYRIPSARLSHWDDGSNALYFVTICTKNRECYFGDIIVETPESGVSTTPSRTAHGSQKWNPGILGVIINPYKRLVTIRARKIHADFGWQSRFHDHIIRNDASWQQIRKYIHDNPTKWECDNKKRLSEKSKEHFQNCQIVSTA